jgi:hypothetical protein
MVAELRFCDIKLARARDLTDRSVIRLHSDQIVRVLGEPQGRPGNTGRFTLDSKQRGSITRKWREVLDVYDSTAAMEAQFGSLADHEWKEPLRLLAEFAFDRCDECYVVVRLLIHETSRDQVDDVFAVLYRHDLVEVQSLPVWEPAPDQAPVGV